MLGLMQEQPLLISSLIDFAARHHGDGEIVSRRVEGDIHRYTYARRRATRARRWRSALDRLKLRFSATASPRWPGTATATSSCTSASAARGRVLHTINPRLHPDQIAWIANHAEDQVLCFDLTLPAAGEGDLRRTARRSSSGSRCAMPTSCRPTAASPTCVSYEDWIGAEPSDYAWPSFDENTRVEHCATRAAPPATRRARSTATARPSCTPTRAALPDVHRPVGARRRSCRWCRCSTSTPGASRIRAAMIGAKLVFPGAGARRQVGLRADRGREGHLRRRRAHGLAGAAQPHEAERTCSFSTLKRTVIGGSACPPAMIKTPSATTTASTVLHAWGMTEMSPLGTAVHAEEQAPRAAGRRAAGDPD